MDRRGFLASVVLGGATAGCLRIDRQVEQVPIWVHNATAQRLVVRVECRERDGDEPLVDTALGLDPGAEQSVYVDPVDADGTYTVVVDVDGHSEQQTLSGANLRNINVEIRSRDRIRIDPERT